MTRVFGWSNVWWLGWRFSRGARNMIGLGLVAGSAAAVTTALLLLAAMPTVRSAQEQAEEAVRIGESGAVSGLYARLNVIEWRQQFRLEQVVVAGPLGTETPPGLGSLPAPGETVISPALAVAASGDEQLARAIPGEVVAMIGDAGLVSPTDLRMYVGVDVSQLQSVGVEPVYVFGAPREFLTGNPVLPILAGATTLMFVVVPIGVVMTSALAQVAVRRSGQLQSLYALGAPSRLSRLAVSVDAVAAASLGSGLGALAVVSLRQVVHGVPFLGVSWWPDTVSWSPGAFVAALLVAPLLALASAATSRISGRFDHTGSRRISLARTVPIVVGLVVLLATVGQRVDGSLPAAAAATVAITLLTIGVPLAAQDLAGWVARRLIGARSVSVHLGSSRVARGPVPARRVTTVIAAVVVLGAAAAPLVAQAAPTDRDAVAANARLGRVVVEVSQLPNGADLGFLRVDGVLAVAAGEATKQQMTFAMPCRTLERFEGVDRDCADGIKVAFGELSGLVRASLGGFDPTWQVRVAPNSSTIVAGAAAGVGGAALVLVEDESAYWTIRAAINDRFPQSFAEANLGGLLGGVSQSFARLQLWLRVGLITLLASAGIAFLMSMSEDARSRRSQTAGLVAAGAPPAVLRTAHRVELATRLGSTTVVATIIAITIAVIAASWTGADPLPAGWMTSLLLALTGLTAATTALVPRLSRTAGTLDELRKD